MYSRANLIYSFVVVLLILNLTLFIVNIVVPATKPYREAPATEPGISALELAENAGPAAYSSQSGVSASSCYTLGPYASERAAQQVMSRIRNYGLAVQMRSLRAMETLNYLVYIPASPSYAAAQAMLVDMAKHDVKEHVIIRDGPYENAISLGFFDDLNKAMRHAEYIRYLGYDARHTEQKAPREVFWLDYDEPFGSNTPVIAWSKAIDGSSTPQLIPRSCR